MITDLEKSFKRKRLTSFIITAGYSFAGGCEQVVILPTVWNYLQSVGVKEEYWLGFTISVYSLAAAIAGVIAGRLADIYVNHTKTIVVFTIALRIVGNFQYALGISVWNILCARLLCGIGSAAGTALMAEICRTTTTEERTGFLSISNGAFNLGTLIGPGIQILLAYFDFKILIFRISPLNAPGVFLGVLWIFYWIATAFMFHNLAAEFKVIEKRRRNPNPMPGVQDGFLSSLNERFLDSRNADLVRSTSPDPHLKSVSVDRVATFKQYKAEFITDTFVLLFSMLFILLFCVSGLETIIPVITQKYFGYGVFENSLIYMVGGLEALVLFFGIAFVGPYVRDTTLQTIGWLLLLFSQVLLMVVIPNFEQGNTTQTVYFILGIMILYAGDPILFVATTGLVSKVLSNETQGLGQGLCRLALYSGLIFGPNWAGSTVNNPYLFLGVSISILLINGIMLAFSFVALRRSEDVLAESKRKQAKYEELNSTLPESSDDDIQSFPFASDQGS